MAQAEELLCGFVEEANDLLETFERTLLAADDSTLGSDSINELFRSMHTLKGGAASTGIEQVRKLAHAVESLLDEARQKRLVLNRGHVELLLHCGDKFTDMLRDITAANDVTITDEVTQLVQAASAPSGNDPETSQGAATEVCSFTTGKKLFTIGNDAVAIINKTTGNGHKLYLLELDLVRDVQAQKRSLEQLFCHFAEHGVVIFCSFDAGSMAFLNRLMETDSLPFYLLLVSTETTAKLAEIAQIPESAIGTPLLRSDATVRSIQSVPVSTTAEVQTPATNHDAHAHSKTQNRSLRVRIDTLDKLIGLAGELVLSRNQLLQCINQISFYPLENAAQAVNRVTSEMQDTIMSTRMQPIGTVFCQFKRVVHDLSKQLGKRVRLYLEGEDVELDRAIIEAIGGPLTHLVRNSMDHGIEKPEAREKAGKSPEGKLFMTATHMAGQVIIEVKDDGAGLNIERIREKALTSGLVSSEQLHIMSDEAVARLIFRPGFSTKDEVTDISGRGVGTDVVQANIAKLGGSVDVFSKRGLGTTFHIKLPLTLAIIPSILVAVGDERFAVPQVNLVELVRIPVEKVHERIESVGKQAVLRLRNELLPLASLRTILGMEPEARELPNRAQARCIIVVAAGNFRFGLVVDNMLDAAEIVVKPMGVDLAHSRIYAGATILGDGKLALILDIIGIANQIQKHHAESGQHDTHTNDEQQKIIGSVQKFVIFHSTASTQLALPTSLVDHIERIPAQDVFKVGKKCAVKRNGKTITTIAIERHLGLPENSLLGPQYIIVLKVAERDIGILTEQVEDTVEYEGEIDDITYQQPGIFGSFLLDDKVSLIVDPFTFIQRDYPDLVPSLATKLSTPAQTLLIDHSDFRSRRFIADLRQAGAKGAAVKSLNLAASLLISEQAKPNLILVHEFMINREAERFSRFLQEYGSQFPVWVLSTELQPEKLLRWRAMGAAGALHEFDRPAIRQTLEETIKTAVPGEMTRPAPVALATTVQPSSDWVVFSVADMMCGINILDIREVNRNLNVFPVHHSPDYIRGIINLRGEIVSIVNMRAKFNYPSDDTKSNHIILTRVGDETIGLLVDKIDDIIACPRSNLKEIPNHVEPLIRTQSEGVIERDADFVLALNLENVLSCGREL